MIILSYAKQIKELREALGYSQAKLAKILGVHVQTISRYERGEVIPSAEILARILVDLDISPLWLFAGVGNIYNEEGESIPKSITLKKKPEDDPVDIKDIPKETIKEWLDDFWKSASEDERVWLKVQFPLTFPQFKAWLAKKQSGGVEGTDGGVGTKNSVA